MHPCQDPIVNRRLLQNHPYPVVFPAKKEKDEPPVVRQKQISSLGGTLNLPPELWAEVFLYCLPGPPAEDDPHPWYNRDKYISPLTAPLLLCQVCRVWREIAVNLPRLWQRLGVYVSMGSACPAPGLAELWLARSGSLPLTLSLHQQNEANLNALVAGRILVLFIKHTSRWANIDLYLAGSRIVLNNTNTNGGGENKKLSAAPILENFRLRTSSRVYEKEERYIFGVFQDVPRLNRLHVSRVPELDLLGNSTVDVPWGQLSTLSLDYVPSTGTALHILAKCHSLEECRIKTDALFGPLLNPDEPLVHAALRHLDINVGYEHFTAFFSRATLPALTHLSVHVRGPLEHYGWEHACFDEFIARSSCMLESLQLFDSGMRNDQFIRLLQNRYLQELDELVVNDRRDWTWDPFVKDVAFDLMNCLLGKETYAVLAALDGGFIVNDNEGGEGNGSGGGAGQDLETDTGVDNGGGEAEGDGNAESEKANGRVCCLPKLTKLVVRGNCLETVDGTIADMVESRFYFREQGVAHLRSIKLDLPSSHLGDLQRLKVMQTEGLDLELAFI